MVLSLLATAGTMVTLAIAPLQAATRCTLTSAERAWLDGSLQASDYVMQQRLRLAPEPRPTIIVFDDRCRFEAKGSANPRWAATSHTGRILLPNGSDTEAVVTSFASRVDSTGERFFVMALPSVWHAANAFKPDDRFGLTGVFLHEFSHTRQMNALKPRFDEAAVIYQMPDDFNDDSIQKHFQADPAFVAVIEKETDLLYRAAEEPDPAKAKSLAQQALALIEARRKRWFVGDDAKLLPYDDLFLTMEGFGQWVAYAWLSDPQGGAMTPAAAQDKMRGSRRWWTQDEGLALFLVIDRFLPDWGARAFSADPKLGTELLRDAIAAPKQPTTNPR